MAVMNQKYLDFYKENSELFPRASRRVLQLWEQGEDPQDIVAQGMKNSVTMQAAHEIPGGVMKLPNLSETEFGKMPVRSGRRITPGQAYGATLVMSAPPMTQAPTVQPAPPPLATPEVTGPGARAMPQVDPLNQDPRNAAAWEAAQKELDDFMQNKFDRNNPKDVHKMMSLGAKVAKLGDIYQEGTAGEKQRGEFEARKYAAASAENQLAEAGARQQMAENGGQMFDMKALTDIVKQDLEAKRKQRETQ